MQRRSFLRRPAATLLALSALSLGTLGSLMISTPAWAARSAYAVNALVSDGSVPADHTDANLKNPWGVAFNPTGLVWVSNNHTGTSTLYDGTGVPQTLVVTIPPAPGGSMGSPTGIVFSGSATDFVVTDGTKSGPSRFLFATEDGTISGWAPNVDVNNAKIAVTTPGAVYLGLALASTSNGNFLYANDFVGGRIDVFDKNFAPVTTDGGFVDPLLHDNYLPFNIQAIGNKLYVAYAKRDRKTGEEHAAKGQGYVSVFDGDGHLLQRLIKHDGLNAPWGMALAPEDFGQYSGALLVGNFGDGTIAAYNAKTGHFRGYLHGTDGHKLKIDGLWGLSFGNGVFGQPKNTLYFAAGVNDEDGGLYGSITLSSGK
jgi:uncharacterized protein (TIGR03118 family)